MRLPRLSWRWLLLGVGLRRITATLTLNAQWFPIVAIEIFAAHPASSMALQGRVGRLTSLCIWKPLEVS